MASTCEPGDRLSTRAIFILKNRSTWRRAAVNVFENAAIGAARRRRAAGLRRRRPRRHRRKRWVLFKENRRLKVSSHVFEERFILGSRSGDHTSIVRSPYPRLRFYSFCARRGCRRLFYLRASISRFRASLSSTPAARFNYFSLFLPPKDLNLQRAANIMLFLILVLSAAADPAGAFHSISLCGKKDILSRAPALANIATFCLTLR